MTITIERRDGPVMFENKVQAENAAHLFVTWTPSPSRWEIISQVQVPVEKFPFAKIKLRGQENWFCLEVK